MMEKIGVRLKLFADDVKVYAKIVDPSDVHQFSRFFLSSVLTLWAVVSAL